MIAYHFHNGALRDGRPVPAIGEKLIHDGPVEICRSGLHASVHPFDALKYAPGPFLCRVECSDPVERHGDKFVCRERTILAQIDATDMLRAFARKCALDVIHLWDAPEVVVRYLETGDKSLRAAAQAAAWDAAGVGASANTGTATLTSAFAVVSGASGSDEAIGVASFTSGATGSAMASSSAATTEGASTA